ncbi:hypothetical protein LUZ62_061317 [Rhynchospora pubera]|uniref:Uncharacterized protein n=1 Tax=Rhynchospora pubera TaxID=906938 RepID=A0AAV8EBV6_9POAL|nr:hypothetical protein LUZ62_061317 [Rhynchospora pubera]
MEEMINSLEEFSDRHFSGVRTLSIARKEKSEETKKKRKENQRRSEEGQISAQSSERDRIQFGSSGSRKRVEAMSFWATTVIFALAGVIASLSVLLCCNRGPSTNLFHLTLVITATVCCWMMWAIVYLAQLKPLINPILSGE